MTLEVRTAISLRPHFLTAVDLIARSVREFYPDAIVTVLVTNDGNIGMPGNWGCGARWSYLPLDSYTDWKDTDQPYLMSMVSRFAGPFLGDHILVLDADVFPIRRFDELFAMAGISGMMTHVAPFGIRDWERLFLGFGLDPPNELHQHSAWGIMGSPSRVSPPYFNSGVVFGPRSAFEAIEPHYLDAISYLRGVLRSAYWFDQLGLALALAKSGVMTNVLPMRYNFANQASFDKAFPDELADVRFLHAMRTDTVDRVRDFASDEAIRDLLHRRNLTGSNEVLRQRLCQLVPMTATEIIEANYGLYADGAE